MAGTAGCESSGARSMSSYGCGANCSRAAVERLCASSEDGTVAGWSPTVNRTSAVTVVDGGIDGPVYKGLAIGSGINSQPVNTLFFAAGPSNETHGQYGRIDMQ
jgi:hypothetical protein